MQQMKNELLKFIDFSQEEEITYIYDQNNVDFIFDIEDQDEYRDEDRDEDQDEEKKITMVDEGDEEDNEYEEEDDDEDEGDCEEYEDEDEKIDVYLFLHNFCKKIRRIAVICLTV